MVKMRWSAAVLAALVGTSSGAVSLAKPPDLPADTGVECQSGREEPAHGTLTLGWDVLTGAVWQRFEPNTVTDAASMSMMYPNVAALVQWLSQLAQAPGSVRNASAKGVVRDEVRLSPEFAATAEQARQLYEIANRCVREGNIEQARACLRQAHLANPTCRFGRLAIERLQQLEATDAEACEEPGKPAVAPRGPATSAAPGDEDAANGAERSLRRVQATTMPLGLVPARTY